MLPVTNNTPLIGQLSGVVSEIIRGFDFRNLLQLHHVHGGELRGDHHHGPQLSPQDGGHTQHARLGQESLPPVAALAASHVKVQFGRGRG